MNFLKLLLESVRKHKLCYFCNFSLNQFGKIPWEDLAQ